MYPSEFVREGIKNIPLRKRRTQRKLAASLGVSKTTVQRWIVDSTIQDQELNAGLYTQAANLPDVNLLDLGFFRAIQSFNDAAPKNEEDLIKSVQLAYNNYPRTKLNRTWLTLQSVFNQIILCNGDNEYDIQHLSKEKLE